MSNTIAPVASVVTSLSAPAKTLYGVRSGHVSVPDTLLPSAVSGESHSQHRFLSVSDAPHFCSSANPAAVIASASPPLDAAWLLAAAIAMSHFF
jgi:hypothetical protein